MLEIRGKIQLISKRQNRSNSTSPKMVEFEIINGYGLPHLLWISSRMRALPCLLPSLHYNNHQLLFYSLNIDNVIEYKYNLLNLNNMGKVVLYS